MVEGHKRRRYIEEEYGIDEDPYIRDENGRPVMLKRGTAYKPRTRASPAPALKPILISGSIFAATLLLTGQLIPAAIVVGGMVLVVAVSRLRR